MEPKIRLKGFSGEWKESTIGTLFSFKNGLNKEKEFFGHGTPIVNYTDVYKNRILRESQIKGKVELDCDEINRYRVQKGDVFFTRTSETPEEVGFSSVLVDDIKDCSFSGFVLRARPTTEELVPEFCGQCFSVDSIRNAIKSTCTYTTRALTNGTVLSKIRLKYPLKEEQTAIANYFTNLDTLIQSTAKKLDKLRTVKAASLQSLFPQEGEMVPRVRFKGFSGEWKKEYAYDLFKTFDERNKPELPVLSATQDKGMVTRESYGYNIFHDKSNESTYKHILPGQFVIHLRSFQGGFAYSEIEGIASPAYTVFEFKDKDSQCGIFWKYIFKDKSFVKRLELITYGIRDGRSISFEEFKLMDFTVPSVNEQQKIASYLQSLDTQISLEEKRLEKLRNIKAACLDNMFV